MRPHRFEGEASYVIYGAHGDPSRTLYAEPKRCGYFAERIIDSLPGQLYWFVWGSGPGPCLECYPHRPQSTEGYYYIWDERSDQKYRQEQEQERQLEHVT